MKLNRSGFVLALMVFGLSFSVSPPAFAHHTTTHSTCAPVLYCLSSTCWYELLNNDEFNGTYTGCTDWVGASISSSTECFNDNVATLSVSTSSFTQNFSVPSDISGTAEFALEFAILGTPTSSGDAIWLEIYEGTLLRKRVIIPTKNVTASCHREDHSVDLTGLEGKSLKLKVKGAFLTSGVSYKINWIQLNAYL